MVALAIIAAFAQQPASAALVTSVEPLSPDSATAPARTRAISALPAEGPVTIDGVLDEPCWQSGLWVDDSLLTDGSGRRAHAQTYFKVRFDSESLYVGVRADEPNMAGIKGFFGDAHDDKVFNDDCIEIWVDPDNIRDRAFHQIFSVVGGTYDEFQREELDFDPSSPVAGARIPFRESDVKWDGAPESAFARAEDHWTCELRLPVHDYGAERVIPGSTWAFNLARERWAAPGGVELSSVTGVFAWPMSAFADLTLGTSPIEISGLDMGGIGVGESLLAFDARSPRQELDMVDVRLTVKNGGEQSVRQLVRLDGSRPERVRLPYDLKPAGECAVTLEVLRPRTNELLFRKSSRGRLDSAVRILPRTSLAYRAGEPFWVDATLAVGDVSFSRAWLKVELVSPKGRPVARQRIKEVNRAMRLNLRLQAAGQEGEYRLRLTVLDGKRELGVASTPIHVLKRRG